MVRTEVQRLRSFGQVVKYQALRSVDFLKQIDDTIYACCVERDLLHDLAGKAQELVQTLHRAEKAVDPDGKALKGLEAARDALASAYDQHQSMRNSAANDPALHEDDGVVEAFDNLLDAMAAAHNAMNDLCWAVGEHDADFDEILDGEFGSAEEMIAALRG
jgi:hypothetical protein